jgi:hypothetical protein
MTSGLKSGAHNQFTTDALAAAWLELRSRRVYFLRTNLYAAAAMRWGLLRV